METKEQLKERLEKFNSIEFWKFSIKIGLSWAISSFILFRIFSWNEEMYQDFSLSKTVFEIVLWCVMGMLFFGPFMAYSKKRNLENRINKQEELSK